MAVGDIVGDPRANLFREIRALGEKIAIVSKSGNSPEKAVTIQSLQTLNAAEIKKLLIISKDRTVLARAYESDSHFDRAQYFLSQME